ncbi:unnamed protein product, partial [Protopolystoma xenopodis]
MRPTNTKELANLAFWCCTVSSSTLGIASAAEAVELVRAPASRGAISHNPSVGPTSMAWYKIPLLSSSCAGSSAELVAAEPRCVFHGAAIILGSLQMLYGLSLLFLLVLASQHGRMSGLDEPLLPTPTWPPLMTSGFAGVP